MLLAEIEVTNFRNLTGKLVFGPHLNLIYGNNGQGKTSWLEAIHVLARAKSFRTTRLQETIRFGETSASVSGRVIAGSNLERDLEVAINENSKSILVNSKRESFIRYLSQLQVFSFTAADLDVMRGMPEARRRFLDRGIASLRPSYLQTIVTYNRVLKQKNKLLHIADEEQLSLDKVSELIAPWNDQLVSLASVIHSERIEFVESINAVLERQLFDRRDLTTRYLSKLEGKGNLNDFESVMRARLTLRLSAEIAAGQSDIADCSQRIAEKADIVAEARDGEAGDDVALAVEGSGEAITAVEDIAGPVGADRCEAGRAPDAGRSRRGL